MWIEIVKFIGFGLFWFILIFLSILLSTGASATKKTELLNQLIFIGVPLLGLFVYKIHSIIKHDLDWTPELFKFTLIVIVPLILAKLYTLFGDKL